MIRVPRLLPASVALLGAAALLAGCAEDTGGADATKPVEMQVFGASSTRVINDELATLAADLDPAQELVFNNDGSGTLVTQLLEGAPADVLITADQRSMDQAVEDGSVEAPRHLAANSMVMVVPAGNPAGVDSVEDLAGDVDLVLCDPQVPCGDVSRRLIEQNDLTVDPVSLEGAVGDVLGKVQNGEADVGWVYRTDAVAAGDDVEAVEIPGAEDNPSTLWVAAATGSNAPEQAARLVEVILSPEVAEILSDAGFAPAA